MSDIAIENQDFRHGIISELIGDENRRRKEDSKKRFEVFNDRQDRFVDEQLQKEFTAKTLEQIRPITSINLTKRIINEQASIYNEAPQRLFLGKDGREPNDAEQKQLLALYLASKSNTKLKKSNKYYKLFDQCSIQVLPKAGKLQMRILAPHHYDVIPDPENPEIGKVYILSIYDDQQELPQHREQDGINQKIGDRDDFVERGKMRFVWWSDALNFMTDGNGVVKSTAIVDGKVVPAMRPNPIGKLPFIDVFEDKDFEYWVRLGKNVVGFNIDFSLIATDIVHINKMSGFAQAVLIGENLPENIELGPNTVINLPTSSTTTVPPQFQFATPGANIQDSLAMLEMINNFFLTAEGLDPSTVSGKGDVRTFSSGVDRFLAELSKFEATRGDFDVFQNVERQLFDLFREWSNVLQNTDALDEELQNGQLGEDLKIKAEFSSPEMLMNQQEREESIVRRLDNKLISRVEAIKEDRGLDTDDEAMEVATKIDEQNAEFAARMVQSLENNLNPQPASEDENGEVRRNEESDTDS